MIRYNTFKNLPLSPDLCAIPVIAETTKMVVRENKIKNRNPESGYRIDLTKGVGKRGSWDIGGRLLTL